MPLPTWLLGDIEMTNILHSLYSWALEDYSNQTSQPCFTSFYFLIFYPSFRYAMIDMIFGLIEMKNTLHSSFSWVLEDYSYRTSQPCLISSYFLILILVMLLSAKWCSYNRMTCDMMVMIWLVAHVLWSYISFFPFNIFGFFFCVHMYSNVTFICSSRKVCFEWRGTVVGDITFIFLTLQYLRAPPSYFSCWWLVYIFLCLFFDSCGW